MFLLSGLNIQVTMYVFRMLLTNKIVCRQQKKVFFDSANICLLAMHHESAIFSSKVITACLTARDGFATAVFWRANTFQSRPNNSGAKITPFFFFFFTCTSLSGTRVVLECNTPAATASSH